MGKYFMGKGVKLLTEETENKIRIYKLGLLQPEFGHMPCISGNAFTFLLAEEGEIQCQINQEKVDLEAGEALFINAGQSYRLVRSEKESSSFYIIEVAGEYLAAGDESLQNKYISPVAEAESFAYCRFMPSAEEDTDEDILLQALLAAAQTAEGRDMAYELDMKSWLFTAWGSLYKKFAQPRPECKNAVIRERLKLNRMTGYLTEHCNEKLTLSAMAEACQVSTGDDSIRIFAEMQNLEQYGCSSGEDCFHGRYCSGKWFCRSKLFFRDFPKRDGLFSCRLSEMVPWPVR